VGLREYLLLFLLHLQLLLPRSFAGVADFVGIRSRWLHNHVRLLFLLRVFVSECVSDVVCMYCLVLLPAPFLLYERYIFPLNYKLLRA
jgi:hypothetical protein